jgi:hypothetical protein
MRIPAHIRSGIAKEGVPAGTVAILLGNTRTNRSDAFTLRGLSLGKSRLMP